MLIRNDQVKVLNFKIIKLFGSTPFESSFIAFLGVLRSCRKLY